MDDAVDLDALFDEISAQRIDSPPLGSTPAAAAPGAPAADAARQEEHESLADKPMYARLGGIVRLLHDSLRELGYDRSLSDVASQITDAKSRLEYVATLTEQAANKVLNAIDEGMPLQDQLTKQAKDIGGRWQALYAGTLGIEEFKLLAGDSRDFATTVGQATEAEKARLLEIMMAQDFQDITGQLIKKIVTITHTAERELAQLLRDNAPPELLAAALAEPAKEPEELMQGPSVPSAALAQDDVDGLLDSLGF
jgi:chemotaxis protein CheZ